MRYLLKNHKLFSALLWLVFVSCLFCLPGSAFPQNDLFSQISFDKWVHIGIFTGILFLWSRAVHLSSRKGMVLMLFAALAYGLLVEVVQDSLIPNRSFDWGDWLADLVGSIAGLWLWFWYKKRPL